MTQFNMVGAPEGPNPKRLLLAVVATSAVLMVYSYFFAPKPEMPVVSEAKKEAPAEEAQAAKVPEMAAPEVVHEQATRADQPILEKSFAVKEKDGDTTRTSYEAVISNQGGRISKYSLVDFSQARVLFDANTLGSSLLSISSKNPAVTLKEDAVYDIVSEKDSEITLRHVTKEGLAIERHYEFLDKSTIREAISWQNLSASPIKVEAVLRAKKSDEKTGEPGLLNPGVDAQALAVKTSEKYQKLTYGDLQEKPKSFSAPKYVAFDDQFFLAAIVPEYGDNIEATTLSVQEEGKERKIASLEMGLKPFVLMQGEKKSFTHQFFMGPKQVDLLSSLPVPLDENIDFGWFGVLSRPMLWLLVQIFGFVKNYGIAIILITVIIKLLTYPLTQKSFSSQQEMKKLQPKIKELQQKFGHDRTLLGQKQMELYRSHGINPVAGCLPLLIQLPIWFAFFQMLRNSVELFDQPFYWWLTDLTRPDQYYVLPVLMGASMLVQQAFTPPPTDQPHMKYVMWAMPIFLTFIMLNMPSGLSLYILTNNLLTIIQQIIIKRNVEKINA